MYLMDGDWEICITMVIEGGNSEIFHHTWTISTHIHKQTKKKAKEMLSH